MTAQEKKLVGRAILGDPLAFDDLVRTYRPILESVIASQVRDASAADDIIQDAFIKVLKRIRGLKDSSRFGPWLIKIVSRTCADWRRSTTRRHEIPIGALANNSGARAADDGIKPAVQSALGKLRTSERQILLMHYFDGCSVGEISKLLSLPIGSVKRKLFESRASLKETLELGGYKFAVENSAGKGRSIAMDSPTVVRFVNLLLMTAAKENASAVCIDDKGANPRVWFESAGRQTEIPCPESGIIGAVRQRMMRLCWDKVGSVYSIVIGGKSYHIVVEENNTLYRLGIAAGS